MQYLNLSFQSMQYEVPSAELTGIASLIHKGQKKSLTDPKSFRKITVCALLGEIKQMAVCDLTFPVLRPLKPSSQLGFTPELFVKLANVMVTEKRAFALHHNLIVLHQFLDAVSAFDKCEHPQKEKTSHICCNIQQQNALKGISPVSDRKMFISYFQPSFLYGLDTVGINNGDIECLLTSYRSVIKHMLAVPNNKPSCTICLTAGMFPAEAQRDLDILGLGAVLSDKPLTNTLCQTLQSI